MEHMNSENVPNVPGDQPNNNQSTETRNLSTTSGLTSLSLTEERAPSQYNVKNPAVKRIMREAQEMERDSEDGIFARPLEDNIFEWHFTLRGTDGTEFELGLYHGRIILPADYPMKPPSIIMLTPNGRFEIGVKICLSISSYHPETWRPSWSIRTALLALQSFMNTPSPGAIGSLDYPEDVRRGLARKSIAWECPVCGPNFNHPVFKTKTANTDLAINRNVNGATTATGALRVLHQPTQPVRLRDQMYAPPPVERPHYRDNPVEAAPVNGTEDGRGDDPQDWGNVLFLDWLANNAYTMTIGVVVVAIVGLLIRRFNDFFTDT